MGDHNNADSARRANQILKTFLCEAEAAPRPDEEYRRTGSPCHGLLELFIYEDGTMEAFKGLPKEVMPNGPTQGTTVSRALWLSGHSLRT